MHQGTKVALYAGPVPSCESLITRHPHSSLSLRLICISSHVVCIMEVQLRQTVSVPGTVIALSQEKGMRALFSKNGITKDVSTSVREACTMSSGNTTSHTWGSQGHGREAKPELVLTQKWELARQAMSAVCCGVTWISVWWCVAQRGVVSSRIHCGGRQCGVVRCGARWGVTWYGVACGREGRHQKGPRGAAFLKMFAPLLWNTA